MVSDTDLSPVTEASEGSRGNNTELEIMKFLAVSDFPTDFT